MKPDLLEPCLVRMPDFAPGEWLNVKQPINKASLGGQIILIDFWEYSCVNCLRTLPYLIEWHKRYEDKGLIIIGVHTPEFKFGQISEQVESAVDRLQIPYPILLDNNYQNWTRFANKAWPSKYLVDKDGYIRFRRQGEGYYQDTEHAIQTLLHQRDEGLALPTILPPLREEDNPGAVCFRHTPELYAGYQGGGLFGGALGNPEGYIPDKPVFYRLPSRESRENGRFYVDGAWVAWPESMAYAGQDGGKIVLLYKAAGVNAVLAPSADPVALRLGLWKTEIAPIVEVKQDGRYLTSFNAGADIQIGEDGRSVVKVSEPRLFGLVRNQGHEPHELTLIFSETGLAFYTFTFNSCVALGENSDQNVYTVK